jgi:hypothetical protein
MANRVHCPELSAKLKYLKPLIHVCQSNSRTPGSRLVLSAHTYTECIYHYGIPVTVILGAYLTRVNDHVPFLYARQHHGLEIGDQPCSPILRIIIINYKF